MLQLAVVKGLGGDDKHMIPVPERLGGDHMIPVPKVLENNEKSYLIILQPSPPRSAGIFAAAPR